MIDSDKNKEELLKELQELKKENEALKACIDFDKEQFVLNMEIQDRTIEQFKLIFDLLPVGISILNQMNQIVFLNPALEKILDISHEGLLRGDYKNRIYLRKDKTIMTTEEFASSKAIRDNNKILNIETGVVKENTEIIWTDVSAIPVNFSDWQIMVITIDITERKILEDKAKHVIDAIDISHLALINKTNDNIITDWNSGAEQIYGYKANEIIGKHISMIIPDERISDIKILQEAINKGEILNNFETIRKTKDGKIINVSLIITPIKNNAGEVVAVSTIDTDITERKIFEQELKRSHQHMESVLSSLSDLVFVIDKDGFFVDYINPSDFLQFYVSPDNFLKRNFKEVFPPDVSLKIENAMNLIKETGNSQQIEYSLNTRNEIYWFNAKLSALKDKMGNFAGITAIVRDITQQRHAEQALKESEEKFKLLFEHTGTSNSIFDLDCRLIMQNKVSIANLGGQPGEAYGKSAFEIFGPERGNAVTERMKRVLSSGIPEVFDTEFNLQTGVKFFHSTYEPIIDGNHCVTGVQVISLDITDRKQAEQALKESEEKYRTIIDNLGEGVGIIDTSEVFIYVNSQAEKIFGTNGDLVGKSMFEFLTDDDRKKIIIESGKRRKGLTSTYEHEIILLDGTKKAIYVTATPKYDEAGEFAGNYAIFMDISYLKKNEANLLESLSMLDASLESTVDGILIVSNNGSISRWNKKFAEMWHLPESIISNLDDSFVINHVISQLAEPEQFIEKVNYLYNHSDESSFDQINFLDGRVFERYSQAQKIGNNVIGRVWSFRDITERIQSEVKIQQQNIELIELNTSKDKFFSIIAHDLLGPMNGFLGLTKMMAEETSDFTLKELQEISINMMKTSNNLYDLLKNLLDWSRIQRGMMEFKPVKLDLKRATQGTLQILAESFNQKQIEFVNNIPDNVNILADEQMLNTILRNFVSNSIKFTNKGGQIEVGVTSNGINLAPIIYIKDTGIGMNSDRIEKLFRLDRDVSRPGTGNELSTGLGLLLCKEFVEMHGGNIWVESEEGKGTTFYFMIENKKNLNNFNKG